jgi:para-aminobenzoate synthetase
MKTLLIDNYDSFTFNLYQLIAEVNRIPPIVVRNDSASWNEIKNSEFDNIVISPGPGRPENESDFGICKQAILEATVPILGVCLGHQGICHLFGGKVDYAEQVMHGRSSDIFHSAVDIFKDIPSPFSAIRYHSLYVKELPEEMEKLAWTANGMLMAAKHRTRPIWGVQFHPDSIKTQYGHQLIENFRTLTAAYLRERKLEPTYYGGRAIDMPYNIMKFSNRPSHSTEGGTLHGKQFKVLYRRVPIHLNAEDVFIQNYADSTISFWLDSALVRGFSRFSYMGDTTSPHSEFISYN